MPTYNPPAQSHWTPEMSSSITREDRERSRRGGWMSSFFGGSASADAAPVDTSAAPVPSLGARPQIQSGAFGTRVNEVDWIRNGGFPSASANKVAAVGGGGSAFSNNNNALNHPAFSVEVDADEGVDGVSAGFEKLRSGVQKRMSVLSTASSGNSTLLPPMTSHKTIVGNSNVICNTQLDTYEQCLIAKSGDARQCNDVWERFLSCQSDASSSSARAGQK